MAKRKYGIDEDKITRFIKEGRGQGHAAEYRPWLTVHDISSFGRSSRIHSRKTGREHHLLSDLETSVFLLLNWSDAVIDIREQFPLDRDMTRRIAAEMGVRHPIDMQSKTEIVMTTDFLVDVRNGNGSTLIVRTVKPSCELDDVRTLEKLEIDRRYWTDCKGYDWGLITDHDLPKQRIENLRWLHELQSLEHLVKPYPNYWEDRCTRFMACLQHAGGITIKQLVRHLESSQGFATGEALTVIRHLAANKMVGIDLDAKFDLNNPVTAISISTLESSARMVGQFTDICIATGNVAKRPMRCCLIMPILAAREKHAHRQISSVGAQESLAAKQESMSTRALERFSAWP